MANLEAKVLEPLKLNDKGVDQYMRVNYAQGQLLVLPSPSYGGIHAQVSAGKGVDVLVERVGTLGDTTWGVLLNAQGQQYGTPMDYSQRALSKGNQVVYVGASKYFPRGKWQSTIEAKKRSIEIFAFGPPIALRYASLFDAKSVTKEDLEAFQGFVICLGNGTYRPWMVLNVPNIKEAAKNPNYKDVRNFIPERHYCFVSRTDTVDLSFLEAKAASGQKGGGILGKLGGLFSRKGKEETGQGAAGKAASSASGSAEERKATPPSAAAASPAVPAAQPDKTVVTPAGKREEKETARATETPRATIVSDAYLALDSNGRKCEVHIKPGQYTIEDLVKVINLRGLQGSEQGVVSDYRGQLKRDAQFSFGTPNNLKNGSKTSNVTVKGGQHYVLNYSAAVAAQKPEEKKVEPKKEEPKKEEPRRQEPAPKLAEPPKEEPRREEPNQEPKSKDLVTITIEHAGNRVDLKMPTGTYKFEQLLQQLPIDLKSERDKRVLAAYIDHLVGSGLYTVEANIRGVRSIFGSKVGSMVSLSPNVEYRIIMQNPQTSTAVAVVPVVTGDGFAKKKAPDVALADVDPQKVATEVVYVLGLQAGGMGTAPWKITVKEADVKRGITLGDIVNDSDKYARTREDRQARDLVRAEMASGNYTIRIGDTKYGLTVALKDIFARAESVTVCVEDATPKPEPVPEKKEPGKKAGKGRGEDRKTPEPQPQRREEHVATGKVSGSSRPG